MAEKSSVPRFLQKSAKSMRRCFMTGKQCIFCGSTNLDRSESTSVFMAMPFQPNLSTSYSWSLKPYIQEQLSMSGAIKVEIMRADEYSHIGAITCEKICRPIQSADLVVVDVSLRNANVMYELGLAIGLEKHIVLIQNECEGCDQNFAHEVAKYMGVNKVLTYPGVAYIDGDTKKLENYVIAPNSATKITTGFKIVGLGHRARMPTYDKDINVSFASIVDGATGVALSRILRKEKQEDHEPARILQAAGVKEAKDAGWTKPPTTNPDNLCYMSYHMGNNDETDTLKGLRAKVDMAFCCIIDLAGESPLAYLWLGYCHAMGISVIPIYRPTDPDSEETKNPLLQSCPRISDLNAKGERSDAGKSSDVLAFDIRALWYINFERQKTESLADLLQSVFRELIVRDLPRLERNRFWGRLTKQRNVHIFTGAVHNRDLGREMVGDWDQRTVSELVRYLSSTDETVTPVLAPPVYTPEYSAKDIGLPKSGKENSEKETTEEPLSDQFKKNYLEQVKVNLQDRNCIIVASADVNAMTEILLAAAYAGRTEGDIVSPNNVFCHQPRNSYKHSVVALKPATSSPVKKSDLKKSRDIGSRERAIEIQRVYSRPAIEDERLGSKYRGFKIGHEQQGQILKTLYSGQREGLATYKSLHDSLNKLENANLDEDSKRKEAGAKSGAGAAQEGPAGGVPVSQEKGFFLLSHLLVMRNPFRKNMAPSGEPPLIVVLNGVSGPGTYALAEMLTGGEKISQGETETDQPMNSNNKAFRSEALLRILNDRLDELAMNPDLTGVQGIAWVAITGNAGTTDSNDVVLFDQRRVHSWGWCPFGTTDPLVGTGEEVWLGKARYPQSNPWAFGKSK